MRTKHPLFLVVLLAAALAASSVPSEAQGRRARGGGHGDAHVSGGVALGLAIGGLLGFYFESQVPLWDVQWYPPYGYPPRIGIAYPPYRYRMVDQSAEVRIEVAPSSAEVYVDGYLAGNVDDFDGYFQRLYVSPGPHEIVVYQEGYRSLVRRMHFAPNASLRIKERLQPLGPGDGVEPRPAPADDRQVMGGEPISRADAAAVSLGHVSVRVQPLDADIVIDGELWQRPEGVDRIVVSLPAGSHQLDVRKPGFVPFSTEIVVRVGETVPLNVSLSQRQ